MSISREELLLKRGKGFRKKRLATRKKNTKKKEKKKKKKKLLSQGEKRS